MIQCVVNPLCLFLAIWGAATVLYLGGVLTGTFPSPASLTVGAVLLNIVTFSLGYLTWTLFRALPPILKGGALDSVDRREEVDMVDGAGPASHPHRPFRPHRPPAALTGLVARSARVLTRDRAARALQFTLLAGLAALLFELYRIVVLAWYFNTTWSYLITHPAVFRLRLVMFISSNIFKTSYTVMLLSLTNSIFSIGFILLGVFLYIDRTRWKYFYLSAFLLISLVIGLMHLSRYEVTANVLYLVFAYCFMYARDRLKPQVSSLKSSHFELHTSHFKLIIPIAAIALLFLIIDLLLHKSSEYSQANRLQGFAFHLFWYLASPLAAFNEFLTTFSGVHDLGQNTFFPIYKWLCRFHLAQEVELSVYGDKVLIPYVANTYTYLRNFYADFGILGVALAPYLLGWLTAAVRLQALRCFHFLNIYLVLMMLILFSFYNYFLSSNQIYMQILFGFLFFRYDLPGPLAHSVVAFDRATSVQHTGREPATMPLL